MCFCRRWRSSLETENRIDFRMKKISENGAVTFGCAGIHWHRRFLALLRPKEGGRAGCGGKVGPGCGGSYPGKDRIPVRRDGMGVPLIFTMVDRRNLGFYSRFELGEEPAVLLC